jgi:hypothetical protein
VKLLEPVEPQAAACVKKGVSIKKDHYIEGFLEAMGFDQKLFLMGERGVRFCRL